MAYELVWAWELAYVSVWAWELVLALAYESAWAYRSAWAPEAEVVVGAEEGWRGWRRGWRGRGRGRWRRRRLAATVSGVRHPDGD